MEKEIRKELAEMAAASVHEAWCMGELKGFHQRYLAAVEAESKQKSEEDEFMSYVLGVDSRGALDKACFKGDKKRNEVSLSDKAYGQNWIWAKMSTLEGFLSLIADGYIKVKRFTRRDLTQEEIQAAGKNYNPQTKEENILRPFKRLSAASKEENMSAAIGAVKIYEEYLRRGYTVEQLRSPELRDEIGTLIHADWMQRNKINKGNEHLFVPYAELDDWTKQQDLDVFYAMLEVVEKNPERYAVERVDGLRPLNAKGVESEILSIRDNDDYWLRNIKL